MLDEKGVQLKDEHGVPKLSFAKRQHWDGEVTQFVEVPETAATAIWSLLGWAAVVLSSFQLPSCPPCLQVGIFAMTSLLWRAY